MSVYTQYRVPWTLLVSINWNDFMHGMLLCFNRLLCFNCPLDLRYFYTAISFSTDVLRKVKKNHFKVMDLAMTYISHQKIQLIIQACLINLGRIFSLLLKKKWKRWTVYARRSGTNINVQQSKLRDINIQWKRFNFPFRMKQLNHF